jgi:hypothetical protein
VTAATGRGEIPKTADTLARVPALIERFEALIRADRAAESPASDDATYPAGRSAWDLATSAWASGGDNLLAWHHLRLGASIQPFAAHYTLIRGALEGAVACRYLLDPYISAGTRRRRAAAAQMEDFDERRKFEDAIQAPAFVPPAMSGADRLAEFKQLLVDNGIASDDEVGGLRTMGVTDRCGHYGLLSGRDGSWLYRLLSAYAHGMQWQNYGNGQIVEQFDAPSGDGVIVKISAREGPVDGATIVAYHALDRGLQELAWYAGRGPKPPRIKLRRRKAQS